jgi:hypothetical protein
MSGRRNVNWRLICDGPYVTDQSARPSLDPIQIELRSDYVGVVWERMDDGGGWKLALARERKAEGHEMDLNKAFSL